MAQFHSKLDLAALCYLKDHKVQGSAVFPAAAYLEMAAAAAAELFGAGIPVLSGVAFQEALILPAAGARNLQLVASPAAGGSASFQIYSSSAHLNGNQDGAAWTLHVSGDMRVETPEFARCAEEQFGLDEIRGRCPRRIAPADLYAWLKTAGLDYGPSFQGVAELWSGEREALGEVRLPSAAISAIQTNGTSDGSWIHPALLDSCVQVLAAAVPEERNGARRKGTYLPSGVSTVRFLARPDASLAANPDARLFSHCAIRPGGAPGSEFLEADIRLLDQDGSVVGELLGFRVKRVV
jgi:acyl transferase domain-containing protein